MPQDSNKLLVTKFFRTNIPHELSLNPYDFIILHTVANYCDLKDGFCKVPQTKLAKECLMSRKHLNEHLQLLEQKKLISRERKWKFYYLSLGENLISSCNQQLHDESIVSPTVTRSCNQQLHDPVTSGYSTIEIIEKEKIEIERGRDAQKNARSPDPPSYYFLSKEKSQKPAHKVTHSDVVQKLIKQAMRDRMNGKG